LPSVVQLVFRDGRARLAPGPYAFARRSSQPTKTTVPSRRQDSKVRLVIWQDGAAEEVTKALAARLFSAVAKHLLGGGMVTTGPATGGEHDVEDGAEEEKGDGDGGVLGAEAVVRLQRLGEACDGLLAGLGLQRNAAVTNLLLRWGVAQPTKG